MSLFRITLLTLFCCGLGLFAQNKMEQTLKKEFSDEIRFNVNKVSQRVTYIEGKFQTKLRPDNMSVVNFLQKKRAAFNLNESSDFKVLNTFSDDIGFNHSKVQQMYKGVPVHGAEMIIHYEIDGTINTINGEFVPNLKIDVTPVLSEDAAVRAAINSTSAEKFRWEIEAQEKAIKEIYNDDSKTWKPKAELFVAPVNGDFFGKEFRLAYKVMVPVELPVPANWIYFIDAKTGEVIDKHDQLYKANSTGSGNTLYNGTVSINTNSYGNIYQLKDNVRNIVTYSSNNANMLPGNILTDNDNNWNDSYVQRQGVSAHWGAAAFHTYLSTKLKRNSINGSGMQIRTTVGCHTGSHMPNNAFWNGAQAVFGTGDGNRFGPLVEIDIVAHEFGHGVTQHTSNLAYRAESGALNEAFSDMIGTAVEFSVSNYAGWELGKKSYTPSNNNDALRYMQNPNLSSDPDTYKGNHWKSTANPSRYNDWGGVHSNNGVGNFQFYLLSAGGNGTNDKGTNYSVKGIGINKAMKIWYRANTTYFTQNTTFAQARTATLSAAKDLYGQNSNEYKQVANAWTAVGVGSGGGNPNPGNFITQESEPNSTASSADGPVGFNTSVSASIGSWNDSDVFYFNADSTGWINVSVDAATGEDLDWYLFHESSLTSYVKRGYTGMDPESHNYNVSQTGKYYLKVVGYNYATDNYTLLVSTGQHIDYSYKDRSLTANKKENKTPLTFELKEAYPNPFNPSTNIGFTIPEDGKVELKVYNTLGQLVKTIVNENMEKGEHKVKWDAKNESGITLPSGIYFIVFKSGNFVKTSKVMFMK